MSFKAKAGSVLVGILALIIFMITSPFSFFFVEELFDIKESVKDICNIFNQNNKLSTKKQKYDSLITVGMEYIHDNNQTIQAIESFTLARDLFPDLESAHLGLALANLNLSNTVAARTNLQKCISINSNEYIYYNLLSSCFIAEGNVQEGINYAKQALKIKDNGDSYFNLSMCYKDNADSIYSYLTKSVSFKKEERFWFYKQLPEFVLCSFHYLRADYDSAKYYINICIATDDNPQYRYILGHIYLNMKDTIKAKENLVISMNQGNSEAQKLLSSF